MALLNTFQKIGKTAAQYVFLPLLFCTACALTSMKPTNEVKDEPQQNAPLQKKELQDLRRVNESYDIRQMKIRFDDRSGDFDIQLYGFDNGENTGTGRPTRMFLGFRTHRGQGENTLGNSTVVKVNNIKFAHDPRTNTQASVDLDIEPNYYGNNKSIFTIMPFIEDAVIDPTADSIDMNDKKSLFEVKKQNYRSNAVILEITDMLGRPLSNPENAVNQMRSLSSLGLAITFKHNSSSDFARTVQDANGHYKYEKMNLIGPN